MEKANLLLVDDNRANLLTLENVLAPLGENLIRASSTQDALRHILEQEFVAILIDTQMRGASAFDFAQMLHQHERTHTTPIIFLTSNDAEISRIFAGDFGESIDCILKPIVPEILRARVRLFIDLARKNQVLESHIQEIARLNQYILKHRELEETIAGQSNWLRTALTSIGDAVLATDREGRVAFLNPVAEQLTGWSLAEAQGKDLVQIFRIINERTRQPAFNPVERVLRDGLTVGLANHTVLIARNGREIAIDDSGAPIRDAQDNITGAILVFRDITEQKRAYQLQVQLAAIVESSDDAIISKDMNAIITSWNKGAERLYGYTAEEIVGKPISVLIPDDWPNDVPNILNSIKQGERVIHYETKRQAKDGRVLDVSLTVSPLRDDEGNIVGASKIARDITEQKRFQSLQAQLAAIVESSDDAIISKDLNAIITSWNKGAERMYGYTAKEIVGKPISVLIPADWPNDVPDILNRIKQGERVIHYETKRQAKDGRVLDVSLTVSPVHDSEGNVIGASKIARDITEQKRFQSLQAQLAAIVESSDDAIIGKDLNGIVTSWNKGAERMYGYTAAEMVGQPIERLIPSDWHNDVPEILAQIKKGKQVVHYETKRQAKDGHVLDVSLTVSPIYDGAGHVVGASKIAHDITARIQRERELAQLLEREQRAVRSRDEFLSVAAHELKTPVTGMRGFSEMLLKQLGRGLPIDSERIQRGLLRIDEQSVKLTDLINQLLDITRIQAGKLVLEQREADLTQVLDDAVILAQSKTEKHSISLHAEPEVHANIDALRFEQVINNLLDNAIKYSPNGGAIDVELSRPNPDHLRVTVTDHGFGVLPERREHLFERFYRAHEESYVEGMGLGLYISRQIIELHGGQLYAEFPEEGGTRFVIAL